MSTSPMHFAPARPSSRGKGRSAEKILAWALRPRECEIKASRAEGDAIHLIAGQDLRAGCPTSLTRWLGISIGLIAARYLLCLNEPQSDRRPFARFASGRY
jgi:hypothetical protein